MGGTKTIGGTNSNNRRKKKMDQGTIITIDQGTENNNGSSNGN